MSEPFASEIEAAESLKGSVLKVYFDTVKAAQETVRAKRHSEWQRREFDALRAALSNEKEKG